MVKKGLNIFIGMFLLVLSFSLISAVTNNCCERTVDDVWCQNAPEEECNSDYRSTPTSCEATSYCKRGCCYDSQEGTCMENTPQKVCEDSGGVWEDDANCAISQCELGCCVLGDQAAFVTQTRCKRLASLYGLDIEFLKTIGNEAECIAQTTSQAKGACVLKGQIDISCVFVSQEECKNLDTGNGTDVEFHEGYLCSSEALGTNCGPTEETTCVEEDDYVHFVDSCGNLANIYDASKIDDKEYWSKIYTPMESCGYGSSNANSASCGNCDYYLGSVCKEYNRGDDNVRPSYGDNICRDLSCEFDGKSYSHGETWCYSNDSTSAMSNLPGKRYFRMVCYNGEVTVEPCADFRQEICEEASINGFSAAACVANKWEDCTSQTSAIDCMNSDKRDCMWIPLGENTTICVPKYSPGFDFWTEETDAEQICSLASTKCEVTYEVDLFGEKECVSGCECLEPDWAMTMTNICTALGDCGSSTNYIGVMGGIRDDLLRVYKEGEEPAEVKTSSSTASSSDTTETTTTTETEEGES